MSIKAQNDLFMLTTIMFNGAVGKVYYDELLPIAEQEGGFSTLAYSLSGTGAFKEIYPDTLTNDEFAESFIQDITRGQVSESNVSWGIQAAKNLLDLGASKADVVNWAASAIKDIETSNTEWGDLIKYYDNATQVGKFWSVDLEKFSYSLPELQSVFAGVTSENGNGLALIEQLKTDLGLSFVTPEIDPDISPIDNDEYVENAPIIEIDSSDINSLGSASITPTDGVVVVEANNYLDLFVTAPTIGSDLYIDATQDADRFWDTSGNAWSEGVRLLTGDNINTISASATNVVYDASNSTLGEDYTLNNDSPLFSVFLNLYAYESLVLKTGDTNSLIAITQYYTESLDNPYVQVQNGKTVIELGDGVNALQVSNDPVAQLFYGEEVNYQDTLVYGFDSNDMIYDVSTTRTDGVVNPDSGVYESLSDFKDYMYVEDGNTVIAAPDSGSIVLVGYTDFQDYQYNNLSIF